MRDEVSFLGIEPNSKVMLDSHNGGEARKPFYRLRRRRAACALIIKGVLFGTDRGASPRDGGARDELFEDIERW